MLFNEKVKHSEIVSQKEWDTRLIGIRGKRSRIFNIVWAAILVAYTIITKIVLKQDELFIELVIVLSIKLLSMLILSFMAKSVFQKNNYAIYKFVKFVNTMAKIGMLIITLRAYVAFFNAHFGNTFTERIAQIGLFGALGQTFAYSPSQFFLFIFNYALLIPYAIWLIIQYFKYLIPPFNIIRYIKWLTNGRKPFKTYKKIDENKVLVIKRRVTDPNIIKKEVILKILFSILVAGIIVGLVFLFRGIEK